MPPEMNWDKDKGTVTLVKGDDTKTFDINKEEDQVSFMKMSQRGWQFDTEGSVELGQLRTVVKNWDSAILAAKDDDEAMGQLVNRIELAVGRKLTVTEKKGIKDDPKILFDDDENSKLADTIKSLRSEISDIKKSQTDFKKSNDDMETKAEAKRLEEEAEILEKKYNGKDKDGKDNGTPKFEKNKVYKYSAENNISNLELAFKMMNFDKLTEASQKEAISDYKKQSDEREKGFTEAGEGQGIDLKISPKTKAKSYRQLGQVALKSAKEKGLNLFIED